jgi:hypothetical protein
MWLRPSFGVKASSAQAASTTLRTPFTLWRPNLVAAKAVERHRTAGVQYRLDARSCPVWARKLTPLIGPPAPRHRFVPVLPHLPDTERADHRLFRHLAHARPPPQAATTRPRSPDRGPEP